MVKSIPANLGFSKLCPYSHVLLFPGRIKNWFIADNGADDKKQKIPHFGGIQALLWSIQSNLMLVALVDQCHYASFPSPVNIKIRFSLPSIDQIFSLRKPLWLKAGSEMPANEGFASPVSTELHKYLLLLDSRLNRRTETSCSVTVELMNPGCLDLKPCLRVLCPLLNPCSLHVSCDSLPSHSLRFPFFSPVNSWVMVAHIVVRSDE